MIVVAPKFMNFIQWLFRMNMVIGGLAIFPFIFLPSEECKKNAVLINHERIHLRQQRELLFFGFVIWYFIALYRKGYRAISFEQEAYVFQENLDYLRHRKRFAFYSYVK